MNIVFYSKKSLNKSENIHFYLKSYDQGKNDVFLTKSFFFFFFGYILITKSKVGSMTLLQRSVFEEWPTKTIRI